MTLFITFNPSTLVTTVWGGHSYDFYFMDEETEGWEVKGTNLGEKTVSEPGLQIWAIKLDKSMLLNNEGLFYLCINSANLLNSDYVWGIVLGTWATKLKKSLPLRSSVGG